MSETQHSERIRQSRGGSVPNKRSKKYQPVGGAYKFYKNEADYLSENIPAESDDCIPVDEITKRDYRLIIENKDLGVKAGSQHLEDNIANHTYKILIENSDKLTNKNKYKYKYKSLIQVPL